MRRIRKKPSATWFTNGAWQETNFNLRRTRWTHSNAPRAEFLQKVVKYFRSINARLLYKVSVLRFFYSFFSLSLSLSYSSASLNHCLSFQDKWSSLHMRRSASHLRLFSLDAPCARWSLLYVTFLFISWFPGLSPTSNDTSILRLKFPSSSSLKQKLEKLRDK